MLAAKETALAAETDGSMPEKFAILDPPELTRIVLPIAMPVWENSSPPTTN